MSEVMATLEKLRDTKEVMKLSKEEQEKVLSPKRSPMRHQHSVPPLSPLRSPLKPQQKSFHVY